MSADVLVVWASACFGVAILGALVLLWVELTRDELPPSADAFWSGDDEPGPS